jgi:hypothetical protein
LVSLGICPVLSLVLVFGPVFSPSSFTPPNNAFAADMDDMGGDSSGGDNNQGGDSGDGEDNNDDDSSDGMPKDAPQTTGALTAGGDSDNDDDDDNESGGRDNDEENNNDNEPTSEDAPVTTDTVTTQKKECPKGQEVALFSTSCEPIDGAKNPGNTGDATTAATSCPVGPTPTSYWNPQESAKSVIWGLNKYKVMNNAGYYSSSVLRYTMDDREIQENFIHKVDELTDLFGLPPSTIDDCPPSTSTTKINKDGSKTTIEPLDRSYKKITNFKKGDDTKKTSEIISNSDGKQISTTEFDPNTGKKIRDDYYNPHSQTRTYTTTYDPNTGNMTSTMSYNGYTGTPEFLNKYDPNTGATTSHTEHHPSTDKPAVVIDYEPNTGSMTSETDYDLTGNKIGTNHYEPGAGLIGRTSYTPGTSIPKETLEYIPGTGQLKGVTSYDPTGKKTDTANYDPDNHKLIGQTFFVPGTNTKTSYTEFVPGTNTKTATTSYDPTTQKPKLTTNFDPQTGKETGYTEYVPGNDKVLRTTKLDPNTNKIDMTIDYNADGSIREFIHYDNNGNIVKRSSPQPSSSSPSP